jgi:hypothetical protein
MISIPIIFGWLCFHRKEQLCLARKPILVCHYHRAGWMYRFTDLYCKRLFVIGKDKMPSGNLDEWDPWYSREGGSPK